MDFAPYQSSPPETTRALSPPPRSSTTSPAIKNPHTASLAPNSVSTSQQVDPWAAARTSALPSPSAFIDNPYDGDDSGDLERGNTWDVRNWGRHTPGGGSGGWGNGARESGMGGTADGAYVFETSLGIRMGVEAALAYLLVPPVGGVALLLFEHKSDYVRFHAWQSSLVFSVVFFVHLVFSWSRALSWILFIGDLVLIAWLAIRAYEDAETLDRLELPLFGQMASRFVDQE